MVGGFLHLSQWKPTRTTNWVTPRFEPGASRIKHAPKNHSCPSRYIPEYPHFWLVSLRKNLHTLCHRPNDRLNAQTPTGQDSHPYRPRRARKGAPSAKPKAKKKAKTKATKKTREVEYIQVPKHWFSNPVNHAMKTIVRPPTKLSRRKEMLIDLRIPEQIFIDLVKPLNTGDMMGFEWLDEAKTSLKPTKETKAFEMYKYQISKPEVNAKFWRMEEREPARRVRKEGKLVLSRRGLGTARLHLSDAAEARGDRSDLLAGVTGNCTISPKVPKRERAMPSLRILLKVSTLSKAGHIEWATSFSAKTAAALRKQMQTYLRSMIESEEYPTLTTSEDQGLLMEATDSVRPAPLALMPPHPRLGE